MKLFRRGSRVLPWTADDATLRAGAVTNPDGSCSIAVINWGGAKGLEFALPVKLGKALRVYSYDSARVPRNAFNDLQKASGTVSADEKGLVRLSVPAKSMTFLTTDYVDRVPSAVSGLQLDGGVLSWEPSADAEHCYYRVFRKGGQIASTVATKFARGLESAASVDEFAVRSVDRWGNVRDK